MNPSSSPIYEAITHQIAVRVVTSYLPDQSDPPERYVWAYMIEIENRGVQAVRLLARQWRITDGLGRTETVAGDGVVGEQPLIGPGQVHRYTSGCPLSTPSGSMVGSYLMIAEDGRTLDIAIPAFSLDLPEARRILN